MEDVKKKRRLRNILLIVGTLIVVGAVVLIVWLVDKNDTETTYAIGQPVKLGGARVTVDGVVFSEGSGDNVIAEVFVTVDGKADMSQLKVAGGERISSKDAVFNGKEYAAAPQGDAESGKYAFTFTAVKNADTFFFIGEKNKVALGMAIVLDKDNILEAK